MKHYLWAYCAAFSVLTTYAAAEPPAGPPIRQTKLFVSGEGGYAIYRIPALAKTTKGTLLAFCEGRKNGAGDSGDIDLLLRRSFDNGLTWEPAQVIVDDADHTFGNPAPVIDRKTGTVVLLATKNHGAHHEKQIRKGEGDPRTVWQLTSRDDGATWSAPLEITRQASKPGWLWYATGPGHGIQLADGRLVVACDHATGLDFTDQHSHMITSGDGGATWSVAGIQPGLTDESTVLELADESLYLNMRNHRGANRRAVSTSRDGGLNWSPLAEDEKLVEPVCQASVLRLSTEATHGRNRVLFSNPASQRRENLTIRLSYDECRTWPVAKTLWQGPAAYSDLVVSSDGRIGCLFECGEKQFRETITYASFTLEWLTDGADHP